MWQDLRTKLPYRDELSASKNSVESKSSVEDGGPIANVDEQEGNGDQDLEADLKLR